LRLEGRDGRSFFSRPQLCDEVEAPISKKWSLFAGIQDLRAQKRKYQVQECVTQRIGCRQSSIAVIA